MGIGKTTEVSTLTNEPEWTDFIVEKHEHHDQEIQPLEEDNEFPNNDDDDYASPRNSHTQSQPFHTPFTRSSEINSQDTPINSPPSYYQSDNDSIQVIDSPSHFDHTPSKRLRTLNDLYENTEELLLAEDEPKNYKEASTDQKWIEAMKVELDSINRNNTWELTTLPKGHKAIGLKWHGIDFEEVFAPVARMETIRLLLAIAANNKWEVHHLDVKSAFLHGDLKEEIQAPRAWNIKLDNTLKSLDFKKCALEQAIYTKKSKDSILLVGVYVDDLIITGTPKREIDLFKAQMEEKFEMSDLGLLAYYLGIEVTQTNGDISIKQSAYANKILKEAGMIDCNETLIPMDPGTRLTKNLEGTMVNPTDYRSLIGCLRYLLHTRPDLSYSIGLLSRFMQEPREQHMKAIRQVLRYVKGTKDYGITYTHNEDNKIHGYSDSSYGVNTQEGKGTTGIIFYYGESPISWSTQKQATVALSSCESEFIAATAAATPALWLKRLLSKLTHTQEEKITIQVDNKSAIELMKNPVFHGRSKHIDTKYNFIRECVERDDLQVKFISGEYQKADILTKALPRIKFLTMRQLIGLKNLQSNCRLFCPQPPTNEAWILFKRVVGDTVETDENLKKIAEKVVEGCGGLPLIIQAVDPKISLAYSHLQLSYDFLESEEAKLCFLLCSMFPEDSNISLERFGTLIGAGIHYNRKATKNKKVRSCTGISLMCDGIKKLPDYELVIPLLDIFLIQRNLLSTIPDEFILGVKEARVLDFGDNKIVSLPPSLKQLTKLCMLNLGWNQSLCDISVLGDLKSLEILILNHTGIEAIPQEIGNLVNLRRLEVKGCFLLSHIAPSVMSKLRWLEELHIGYYQVGDRKNKSLVEKGKLSMLTFLDLFVPHIHLIPKVEYSSDWDADVELGGENTKKHFFLKLKHLFLLGLSNTRACQFANFNKCMSLKEVIWDEADIDKVVFRCLIKIELRNLKNLKSFYAGKEGECFCPSDAFFVCCLSLSVMMWMLFGFGSNIEGNVARMEEPFLAVEWSITALSCGNVVVRAWYWCIMYSAGIRVGSYQFL
ncbi:ribonuclease H-like domain, reverse transcriptase, RNA-dependent DNA polymerase [Tanacetum coccineum]